MKARILVIEDNPDNLRLAGFLLSAFGHEPLLAQSATVGIELATETKPDLILLDLQMPELDGFEAARRLRAKDELAQTPIVALTAYAMSGDRERVLAAGFDGYLTKPLEPGMFRDQIAAFLPTTAESA
jgi:two-component system, cell cycle response regulator DivK